MELKQMKRIVSQGFIDNVIFYDEGAAGTITKKVLYLMWGYCEDDVDHFYIPTDVYPDFDFEKGLYGVNIIRDKRLNEGGAILKYYEKLGAKFPWNKRQLILAVGKKHSVLGAV